MFRQYSLLWPLFVTLIGTGEQPVTHAENYRLDTALATVVSDFNERMIQLNE